MYKRDFSQNIESFYDFIDFGLQQKNSSGIVRNTCGLIADLCVNECAGFLVQKLDCIMPKVFDLLSDTNVDWSVKIWSITNIGDLLGVSGEHFAPYMVKAMQILEFASKRIIEFDRAQSDEDYIEYIMSMSQILIETYTSII